MGRSGATRALAAAARHCLGGTPAAALGGVGCLSAGAPGAAAQGQAHRSVSNTAARAAALVPIVIDQSPRGERAFDIFSRLLRERIVCVNGPINDDMASSIVAQLLYLESENPETPVHMYINSPGGVVTSGLAIYDTMQYVRSPVSTLCVGQAASMATLLLSAGEKGHRRSLPNARLMVHQPSGEARGQTTEVRIYAHELLRTRDLLNHLYSRHTGKTAQDVEHALERDNFMSPTEALEFGLIDEIIERRPEQQ